MKKLLWILWVSIFLLGCQNNRQAAQSSPMAHMDPTKTAEPIDATTTAVPPTETPNPIHVALTAAAATQSAAEAVTPLPTATVALTLSPEVEAYLNAAIDIIRENALFADQVDWDRMETAVFVASNYAITPEQTYPSIRFLLEQLGDNHSRFFTPEEAAFWSSATLDDNPSVSSEMISERLGYINVPEFISADEAVRVEYATLIQTHLAQLAAQQPCGWIVDLRNNTGGSFDPMMAGLAPLFGDGLLGYYLEPDSEPTAWGIAQGLFALDDEPVVVLDQPLVFADREMPVAVLIGPFTASSGEAVAISFIGRPETRLFGNPTRGVSTSNTAFEMPDGALLIITTALMADRNQTPFGEEIVPDVIVTDEMTLETAVDWLLAKPACAS